jgi:hypothetical protein
VKAPFFDPYKLAEHPLLKLVCDSGLLPARAHFTVNTSTLPLK